MCSELSCNCCAQSYGHQQATVNGGWDKCLGPFDHYQAKAYGIDTWDCHYNNCYVRRDHNGGKLKYSSYQRQDVNITTGTASCFTGTLNN
jgi:hypothetical protein